MPFVGLTGGMGAGKSTALEALRRLGAEVLSSDAVVHELYEGEQLRDAVVARFGAEVAPGGVVDRAAVAAPGVRDRARTGRGSRAWCGRWSARGSRAGSSRCARSQARAAGGRGRGAAAVRGRAWTSSTTRRSRWSPRSRCAAQRAAERGHALVDERAARQLSQEEKARRATFVVRNDGTEEDLERELSAVLDKLGG